ncbi:MAG: methyltransferase domain-containing protein [Acidobacteriota bacterium]|nr:methyltransferase domain-containing protein [Acidobacteriota bacterium]
MKQQDPEVEIAAGNPWYLADQFKAQLGSRGRRRVIENRWRVFGEMLQAWAPRPAAGDVLQVLDAGCGDGINLIGLRQIAARQQRLLTITGVDYNPLRLQRARTNDAHVRLQRASLTCLPFVEGAFDVVLCSHVIEHIPDLAPALTELFRSLRPGGLLIVGVPNEGCLTAYLRNHWIQPSIGRDTDHVNFFTDRTLTAALTAAGFSIRRVERETFFFPHSYINAGLNELAAGHWLMAALRRLVPSQAGGLIVAAEKPATAGGVGNVPLFRE